MERLVVCLGRRRRMRTIHLASKLGIADCRGVHPEAHMAVWRLDNDSTEATGEEVCARREILVLP